MDCITDYTDSGLEELCDYNFTTVYLLQGNVVVKTVLYSRHGVYDVKDCVLDHLPNS